MYLPTARKSLNPYQVTLATTTLTNVVVTPTAPTTSILPYRTTIRGTLPLHVLHVTSRPEAVSVTYPIPNDVLKPIVNATHLPNDAVSPTVAHAKIPHMTPRAAPQHGITITHVRPVTLPLNMSPRLFHNKTPPILRASSLLPHSHPNQALTLIVGPGTLLPKIVICVLTRRL